MKIKIFLLLFFMSMFFTVLVHAGELHPSYNLSVSFDLEKHLLKGVAVITLPEDKRVTISVENITILSMQFNAKPLDPEIKDGVFSVNTKGTLLIAYEAPYARGHEPDNAGEAVSQGGNIITDRGIYLTRDWYPAIDSKALYDLTALLPPGFNAISEADEITKAKTGNGDRYAFTFAHPLHNLHLIAGKYRERKDTYNGIDIFCYFFTEEAALAKTFLEHARRYLVLYEDLIGPYPYKRFSIVEHYYPAGYSLPTFTLLGQDSIRLPSSPETSLGHEILRQWFGNYLYVNDAAGDWSGALVVYLAGLMPAEQKGNGAEFRKNLIADYKNYMTPAKELALKDLKRGRDSASAAGDGKGAMVFHMLKQLIGKDAFFSALRTLVSEKGYQDVSWNDLRTAFEKGAGQNLGWFFSQWLERKGLPALEVREPGALVAKGTYAVTFDIIQNGETYILNLPVQIKTGKAEIKEQIKIEKGKDSFEVPVQGEPAEMTLDGNYDIMRDLSAGEYPPLLSKLFGDDKKIIVTPAEQGKYTALVNLLQKQGFAAKDESEITDEDIRTHSLMVLDTGSPILKRLFGAVKQSESGFVIRVRKNPLNTAKVVAIASGDSKNEVDLAAQTVSDYGNFSYLRFNNGRITEKKTAEADKGIIIGLDEPVKVVQPGKTMELDHLINAVLDKPIIYIGEKHTNYEDHKVQLKIIMSLHERGRKIAIGMEMFQRPFQKAIDDYLSGAISNREFLKNTQYYKRWQFDYKLYREIIDYAKANHIPVIALNLWSEIIRKVASEGLDSLTFAERGDIPESMDMGDEDYRERLSAIFRQHRNHSSRNFEDFYQSQVLWDETMAASIDAFLRKNPGYQMIVLAGTGHIMYDSGIPKRVHRLNGKDYSTIIPGTETLDEALGDYLISASPLSLPTTFKLGVVLKEKNGRVEVEDIVPGSIAKKAGIQKGDILAFLDDWKIEEIPDVHIFMYDKKRGEKFTATVLRKGFLSGYKEVVLSGTI
jgi:uncharacterized iron-regulated protein